MDLIKGKQRLIGTFFATLFYVLAGISVCVFIQPFSVSHFISPAAGVASAFALIWGTRALISIIIIGTIFSSFIFLLINGVAINFSILLIAILAISFQAFWTRELTRGLISNERWLKSQTLLFYFLLKIGPLAGVVAASASVVIMALDVEMPSTSIVFVFFNSWVISVLSALFFVPAVLISQGTERLSLSKRYVVLFVSALGFIAIVIVFKISQNTEQHQRIEHMDKVTTLFETFINDEIKIVDKQIRTFSALFKASKYVSNEQFITFAAHNFRKNTSIRAVEWVPLIKDEHRESFEKIASEELGVPFVISQQLDTGQVIKSATRANYLPVYYIYPHNNNKSTLGLDLLTYPAKKLTMEQASTLNTAVASAPLTLVQDNHSNPGMLIFHPILNKPSLTPFGISTSKKQNSLTGYVLIIVQFDDMFNHIENLENSKGIEVMIEDITTKASFLLYGDEIKSNGRLSTSITLDTFARKYLINISEAQVWVNQEKSWGIWTILAGAALGGFVFQFLILTMAAYSAQLSDQVRLKTRELMKGKEVAEQNNQAKSHFLKTLSGELKSSVEAIDYFIEKFHQNPTFEQAEKSIGSIGHSSDNLTQVIDTLTDLTDIEAEKSTMIKLSVFDFYHFLQKIEILLPGSHNENKVSFTFVIDEKVPRLIESDELRIQKLIIALAQNASSLLNSNAISLSVKAHFHQLKRTTLFFVLTPITKPETDHNDEQEQQAFINQELGGYSTSMAMVKELCQLFDGDIHLNQLASGQAVLSASIKINLPLADHVLTEI